MSDVDSVFRSQMRALAHKGGAVTKRRYGNDPRYYRDIGRLGGSASVAARKERIVAELDGLKLSEASTVEPSAAPSEVPSVRARPTITLADIRADMERERLRKPASNDWRNVAAEEELAPCVAPLDQEDLDDEDEPWDPWGNRL